MSRKSKLAQQALWESKGVRGKMDMQYAGQVDLPQLSDTR
jgi:hypothetical protein